MAKKKGGKDFSVDEYFAGYSKKKKKEDEEDISELLAASRKKKESGERRREEDLERYERLSDVAKRAEGREEHGTGGERHEEEITSQPLIISMYLFRAFAIVVMLMLMLFVLEKQVPGFGRAVDWIASTDSFVGFILANLMLSLGLFIVLSGLQLLYYVVHWVAHKKWKGYARAELVYSVGFALVGLLGAAAIILALGY
jgi:hypothetical protein